MKYPVNHETTVNAPFELTVNFLRPPFSTNFSEGAIDAKAYLFFEVRASAKKPKFLVKTVQRVLKIAFLACFSKIPWRRKKLARVLFLMLWESSPENQFGPKTR